MNPTDSFLFVVCQPGAEAALKRALARRWPAFRFAFSRPGFVTFKLPADFDLPDDFDLGNVFARTAGFCCGRLQATLAERAAAEVWQLMAGREFQHAHVWQRDRHLPGERGFEPGETPLAAEVGRAIAAARPAGDVLPVNREARRGELILDCVLVEPHEWWIGFHRAADPASCWPGGVPDLDVPDDVVSRAYLKVEEAIRWSRMPVRAGDRCVEIGSSPGGSCQALLDRGLIVTGIDPAEMEPAVLEHPNFTHVKARGADLKRREFRDTRWLLADSNVAPKHTLDTVEHIVTHRQVRIRGLLLTLKLLDWKLADEIPHYLERVRGWGFEDVRARQLAYNRREICIAALRRPRS